MSEGGTSSISSTSSVSRTASTSNGIPKEGSTEMSVYKKEACKVITFRIVHDKDDLESEKIITFKPEMAHQVFGESESIFGYRNLSITINFVHNSCHCYIEIASSGKINTNNMKADDIVKSLDPWLPSNYTQSFDEFLDRVDGEEHDKMYGEVIKTFSDSNTMQKFPNHQVSTTYRITKNDVSNETFTEFHSRFETFIIWFIDAANFIDLEDGRWLIFYVYEEYEHPISKKIFRSPIAFCTVYKFYCYPKNIRARISQFFVLPSHQKRGVGTALYETIAKTLRAMDEVVDITVEEPTPAFQKIRDLEDCGILHRELIEKKLNYFGTSSKEIFEMGRRMKIGRRQVQRVYDILGLYYASQYGPVQYQKFLDNIKGRISDENDKESRPGKRFCNLEGAAVTIQIDKKVQVETEFKRHCDDIEPSVKYLEAKLEGWLKKNGY